MGGMRVVPVIDLMDGHVVHGIAGRRHEYRPIVSRLAGSCRPLDVARAFRDHLGLAEQYLADLDAIAGASPAISTYDEIRSQGIRLWVDAGVRDAMEASSLAKAGVDRVVLGLETIRGPAVLEEACATLGAGRIIFSLDLREGRPLCEPSSWRKADPWSIAEQAIAIGVRRLLVLDLARVGVGGGTGTEELCARLAAVHPEGELASGGGVNGIADLERLRTCGVKTVLVASALHDGRLRREDLAAFLTSSP
jgi:phosphoribosylformimino-5-aminoimidazole carboxamide ribotide isomerase